MSEQKVLTIRQVAQLLNIHEDTIRYWEKQGLIQPKKNKRGWRIFTEQEIVHLRSIKEGPFFKKR